VPEQSEQTKLLERMVKSLEALEKAGTGGSSAGSRAQAASKKEETSLLVRSQRQVASAARGGGGGLLNAGLKAAAAATVGLAGQGVVSASHGGTFGGGAARAAINLPGQIPVVGGLAAELLGTGPASRIASGTQGDLDSLTNEVARYGGPISPKIRSTLAANFAQQNKNIEADRQANTAATNGQLGAITAGQGGLPELIAKIGQLVDTLTGQSGNGANHRT